MGRPFLSFNGPGIPSIRAQKLFLLFFSDSVRPDFLVTGAFKLLPVARLYLALPLEPREDYDAYLARVIEQYLVLLLKD